MTVKLYGTSGTVNERTEAQRFNFGLFPNLVNGPSDFRVRAQPALQRSVEVLPGEASVLGVLVVEDSRQVVSFPENKTTVSRWDQLCINVKWEYAAKSQVSSVEYKVIPGDAAGNVGVRAGSQGTEWDFCIACVRVRPNVNVITPDDIIPCAPYGGPGGVHIAGNGLAGVWRGRDGTRVYCDADDSIWEIRNNLWVKLSQKKTDWKTWTPTIKSPGGVVNLGNGGKWYGRYKVLDGWCLAEWEVRVGVSGYNMGNGGLTIDLPETVSNDHIEQAAWSQCHLYTTSEAPMDWAGQVIVRRGQKVGDIFAPTSSVDCRMIAARAADGSNRNATGIPWIATGRSDPVVMSGILRYRVEGY